jgi:hypothetical protein
VYFALYNYLKSTMAPEGRGGHFVLGAATGIVYWLSVFGLDTIKTRLMVDLAQEKPVSDSFFSEKQRRMYLTHSPLGLYVDLGLFSKAARRAWRKHSARHVRAGTFCCAHSRGTRQRRDARHVRRFAIQTVKDVNFFT